MIGWLESSWGGWWWCGWLEGSWGGWVWLGGGGGEHGGVDGWRVYGSPIKSYSVKIFNFMNTHPPTHQTYPKCHSVTIHILWRVHGVDGGWWWGGWRVHLVGWWVMGWVVRGFLGWVVV